jgi:hypothetical protein
MVTALVIVAILSAIFTIGLIADSNAWCLITLCVCILCICAIVDRNTEIQGKRYVDGVIVSPLTKVGDDYYYVNRHAKVTERN